MRIQVKIFFILILSYVALSSYAYDPSEADYAYAPTAQNDCSMDSAFNQGLNDGMSSYTMMQYNYAASINCTNNQAALNDAYKQGFLTGLPHRPQRKNATVVKYPDGAQQNYSN